MDAYAYIDIAHSGESNMAIDRQLLELAERDQCAWVRLYRWSQPTLSLGRFQASLDRGIHAPSAQLPSVLRPSGGGAIVHHHEWTYSVALPVGRNQVGAAPHLYDIVHDSLVAGLVDLGWKASKWTPEHEVNPQVSASMQETAPNVGCSSVAEAGRQPHFLCFSRRSCGDIVCNGFKVVGSAQRRLGSSVLQHGSILFARSEFAPELPGLADLPRDSMQAGSRVAARWGSLENLSKRQLETDHFAELVLSWLTDSLSASLGVVFEHVAAPPARIA